MNIPSQSQSSPIIHFTNAIRHCSSPSKLPNVSPSKSIDDDHSQPLFSSLLNLPQSTPKSSPILVPRLSINIDQQKSNENLGITIMKINRKKRILNFENTSLTNITPLNDIQNRILLNFSSSSSSSSDENDEQNVDRYCLRPPPLMVLSQSIQAKHPEQLNHPKLTDRFSSIKDLPLVPANYSFVFYNFTQTQIEESKRLTRRMGDCFTSEQIDMTTTHIIFPMDDSQMNIQLDLILASLYGCCFVTFDWLKCSSRIGEWINVKNYQPKNLLNKNSFLNFYRKNRHEKKSIQLFHQSGFIYLTSIVQQRSLLLKLITLLGGNITINRNRAKVIVGHSSKSLPIINYPQVTEQWIIDSIFSLKCLPFENYLIENPSK